MAKTKSNHTHKLKRHKHKTGNAIFFCCLPDCNFKISTNLALGKRSLCWRCGESFIMSDYALRLAKPHCELCHKPKEVKMSVQGEVIQDMLDNHKLHEDVVKQYLENENTIKPQTFEDVIGPELYQQNKSLSERLQQILNNKKQQSDSEEEI